MKMTHPAIILNDEVNFKTIKEMIINFLFPFLSLYSIILSSPAITAYPPLFGTFLKNKSNTASST